MRMPIALWLLAGGLALVAGCSCPPRTAARPDGAAADARAAPRPIAQHFPSEALREQMRKLHVYGEELRRRALRGQLGNAPTVLLKIADEMPRSAAPEVFLSGLKDLRERAAALNKTSAPREDYARLVEACVACHEQLAPQLVAHVTRLRLTGPGAPPDAAPIVSRPDPGLQLPRVRQGRPLWDAGPGVIR